MEGNSAIVSDIKLCVNLNNQIGELNNDIEMNEMGEREITQESQNNNSTVPSKCQSKQLPTTINDSHQVELAIDEEDSCESESTCTILEQSSVQNEDEEDKNCSLATSSNQILSVSNLNLASAAASKEEFKELIYHDTHKEEDLNIKDDTLVEIELRSSPDLMYQGEGEEIITSENNNMFTGYHHERPISSQEIRGFSESKPKLSFSSERMKEYFETFKSHSGETIRLYQFFKSTRTELVACFLFTLISSHALIMSRTHLNTDDIGSMTRPLINIQDEIIISKLKQHYHKPVDKQNVPINNYQSEIGSKNNYNLLGEKNYDYLLRRNNNGLGVVHLASGLVISFTVTSLTQVFGHISGCHLLPSISLALFIKGHISRARLVSYLAAQSMGSLLGVSLLSLLTSSQITPEEYNQLLLGSIGSEMKYNDDGGNVGEGEGEDQEERGSKVARRTGRRAAVAVAAAAVPVGALNSLAVGTIRSRRKREADDLGPDINLNDIQGSETILMSIVEQQQEHQLQKQRQQRQNRQQEEQQHGKSQEFDKREIDVDDDRERTITTNVSTDKKRLSNQEQAPYSTPDTSYQKLAPAFEAEHSSSSSSSSGSSFLGADLRPKEGVALGQQKSNSNGITNTIPYPAISHSSSDPSSNHKLTGSLEVLNETSSLNDKSRVTKHATGITTATATATTLSSNPATTFEAPQASSVNKFQRRRVIPGDSITTINNNNNDDVVDNNDRVLLEQPVHQNKSSSSSSMLASKKLKLRRRKRNKTQHQQTNNTASHEHEKMSYNYYINMLEFALPDSIMSSDSIRQCIEKQGRGKEIENSNEFVANIVSKITSNSKRVVVGIQQMAARSFQNCLSSSNSSQMFIFQLLATLLIVLTYLINVDPRRVDLGFKSLSIGLSYFVASALTIQSGGFFGNPFHLLFLNWFTPSSNWRVEWFIYLFTPFIAGLFGAISHEYIDFTSLRNRNKQLHLRRSFYSLENLQGTYNSGNNNNDNNSDKTGHNNNNGQRQAQGLEISTLNNLLSESAPGRARRVSSSSSLESSNGMASSVLTSAEDHHHYMNLQQQQQQQQQQNNHLVCMPETQSASSSAKKAVSYSRQLKLEQRQQLQILANGSNLMPKTNKKNIRLKAGATTSYNNKKNAENAVRRSDFDSNFLISSSPTANSRHQINTSGIM